MEIEAGKYYRTRDGRKVGPMVLWGKNAMHPFEVTDGCNDDDILDEIWADNGTSFCMDDRTLIAEWTDEPPHFTHMLAELQGVAEKYGYTISEVSTDDGPIGVGFTLTN